MNDFVFMRAMEPITIIILTLFAALASAGVISKRRSDRWLATRDAVRARSRLVRGRMLSIFDVFWDLGASEYALALMAHQSLLFERPQDVDACLLELCDRIEEEGSYETYIRETLEAIQEVYNEHRRAGNRRLLPTMTTTRSRTMRLAAVGQSEGDNLPVLYYGEDLTRLAGSLDEREALRSAQGQNFSIPGLLSDEVDIDEVARVDPLKAVLGVFSGDTSEVKKWWEARHLRTLRAELDRHLQDLYELYARLSIDPGFSAPLFDTVQRWEREAKRIDDLSVERPWRTERWAACADALAVEARATARRVAWVARTSVERTLGAIREHVAFGRLPMAGYLLYLNRDAFFVADREKILDIEHRIQSCLYRIRETITELRVKGVY